MCVRCLKALFKPDGRTSSRCQQADENENSLKLDLRSVAITGSDEAASIISLASCHATPRTTGDRSITPRQLGRSVTSQQILAKRSVQRPRGLEKMTSQLILYAGEPYQRLEETCA